MMQFFGFSPSPRCATSPSSESPNQYPESIGTAGDRDQCSDANESHPGIAHDLSATTMQVCPICYEEKDDVAVLDHWQPSGDISQHKMCGTCRASVVRNECPFCKEIVVKEDMLSFIRNFVQSVSSQAKTRGHVAHDCAAIFEMW